MNTDKIYAENIANQYSVKKTSKVVALKKLDRKVKRPPTIFAYTWGVVFTLIMGVGMCFCLGALGNGGMITTIVGSIVGVVGIIGACVTYPIYKKWLASRKAKYAGDIIKLAEEVAEEE